MRSSTRSTRPRRPNQARLQLVALEDRATPATFTVTTTADNGNNITPTAGSLREAIKLANVLPDADDIVFNIPGAGVQTITLSADLPPIAFPVRVNGYTQPGSSRNTLAVGNDAKILIEVEAAGRAAFHSYFGSEMAGSVFEGLSVVNSNFYGFQFLAGVLSDVIVRGNFIGIRPDGATVRGNVGGVYLGGTSGHVVGGPAPGDRNVISGNTGSGVLMHSANAGRVENNYVGTTAAGTAAAGNGDFGVNVENSNHTVVGNVISGNGDAGVFGGGGGSNPSNMTIRGNLIGTNATGTGAVGNKAQGIFFRGTGHQIGGTTAAERNVISGNTGDGIFIGQAKNVTVQGNHIGTNAAGDAAVPNGDDGVEMGAESVLGGLAPGAGNLISGNIGNGVFAYGKSVIQGNKIGTKANGVEALGNLENGVSIAFPGLVTVGGDAAEAANTIAFNAGRGIFVTLGSNPTGNTFLRNSIHSNGKLGIEFEGAGGNRGQTAPILTSASVTAGGLTVAGRLETTTAPFRVQFFASPAADPSGFGEGQAYLGETTLTTGADGKATFSVSLPAPPAGFGVITAIATNTSTGDSSEFSNAVPASAAPTGGTISGVVFNDANANKVRDAGEAGLAGFTPFVDANGNGTLDAGEPAATTDANGAYTLQLPADGTYAVRLQPPAGYTQTTDNPAAVPVSGGQAVTGIDFGVRQPPAAATTVQGVIFTDANGNGARDAGETGLGGATVFLDLNGNAARDAGEPAATTAADGIYALNPAGGGNFLVRLVVPAGSTATSANPVAVTVGSGQAVDAAPIGVRTVDTTQAVLRGTVYQDLNGNRIRAAGEPGLAGVTVYLDANGNRQLDANEPRTTSAGDGTYQLLAAPGQHAVRAVRPAGFRQTTENPGVVTAASGQQVSGLDFGFQRENEFRARKGRLGWPRFAVGPGPGGSGQVTVFNPDGSPRFSKSPFPGGKGGVRVAVADVTGDDEADVVAGAGPGDPPLVRVLDGATGDVAREVETFEASFTGGVYVATADFDGDGFDDTVVTPDEGGGPRVVVRSGRDGSLLANFFGIDDPNFRGGARAAVGDINGDGTPDLVVAAGFQGGPRVAAFDGKSLRIDQSPRRLFGDFFAFEETLRNGVFVACGDVDGDGFAEVIAGGGPGGGPRVTAFSGKALLSNQYVPVANFFGGDPNNRGGIRVTVKDLDGDERADLVVGSGTDAPGRVTAYLGKDIGPAGTPAEFRGFDPFPGFTGGVFVG